MLISLSKYVPSHVKTNAAVVKRLAAFVKSTKSEFGLSKFSMTLTGTTLYLNIIQVSQDRQGEGLGSKVLARICEFADEHQVRVAASPAKPEDGIGTSSQSRLTKFYKRFGFVVNIGRNKDPELNELMYRPPKGEPK